MKLKVQITIGALIIITGIALLIYAYINNSGYTAGVFTLLFGIAFIIKTLGK